MAHRKHLTNREEAFVAKTQKLRLEQQEVHQLECKLGHAEGCNAARIERRVRFGKKPGVANCICPTCEDQNEQTELDIALEMTIERKQQLREELRPPQEEKSSKEIEQEQIKQM